MSLAIGAVAPTFSLPDTEATPTPLVDPASRATVVVFTCNHCPYALAWHDRLQAVARDYAPLGVRMVQINANDAVRYPRDSLQAMADRFRAGEFAGPYLHDESQEVARAWEAGVTPEIYVVAGDGRLAYRGAADADHGDESLAAGWLRGALDDVLAGRSPEPAQTRAVGCSIKWRPQV
jgi:peroxiredoxin